MEKLKQNLARIGKLAVAFSGGVDSTFLAAVASAHCRDGAVALTAVSEFQASRDIEHAARMAADIGIEQVVVPVRILGEEAIARNAEDRCYHCKKLLFSQLSQKALSLGFDNLAHGANLDDLTDYRPGFAAAQELGVLSPLIDAGLTKDSIRELSRELELETWDMPSQSCLASRIPYGRVITADSLKQIETAEMVLLDLGFRQVRVRKHGGVARIETDLNGMGRLLEPGIRTAVSDQVKRLGFRYACLDLDGYVSGSMNR